MKQPALYCAGAYAANVIPRDFIDSCRFPLQSDNVALVSDPFSGADVSLKVGMDLSWAAYFLSICRCLRKLLDTFILTLPFLKIRSTLAGASQVGHCYLPFEELKFTKEQIYLPISISFTPRQMYLRRSTVVTRHARKRLRHPYCLTRGMIWFIVGS